jgi:hypothetical protein
VTLPVPRLYRFISTETCRRGRTQQRGSSRKDRHRDNVPLRLCVDVHCVGSTSSFLISVSLASDFSRRRRSPSTVPVLDRRCGILGCQEEVGQVAGECAEDTDTEDDDA